MQGRAALLECVLKQPPPPLYWALHMRASNAALYTCKQQQLHIHSLLLCCSAAQDPGV